MDISAINNYAATKNQNFKALEYSLFNKGEFTLICSDADNDSPQSISTHRDIYWYCPKDGETKKEIKAKVRQFEKDGVTYNEDGDWLDVRTRRVQKVVNELGEQQLIKLRT